MTITGNVGNRIKIKQGTSCYVHVCTSVYHTVDILNIELSLFSYDGNEDNFLAWGSYFVSRFEQVQHPTAYNWERPKLFRELIFTFT